MTPLQGIKNLLGDRVKINYAKGCSLASLDTSGIAEAVDAARHSDVAFDICGGVRVQRSYVILKSRLLAEKESI